MLSVVFIVADHRYQRLEVLRDCLSQIAYPVYWAVDAPSRLFDSISDYATSKKVLLVENEVLKQERIVQGVQLQKLLMLETENQRLRNLLNADRAPGESVSMVEIMRVSSDPFANRLTLNKGKNHGVFVGQPVIDADGVIGEVIEVGSDNSRAILLTDANYAIPVENVRTGARGIAAGIGKRFELELQHVPNTIDVKEGDELVTSGLDGHYPAGYSVGYISYIEHAPGEPFARVSVKLSTHTENSRQILLLHSAENKKK